MQTELSQGRKISGTGHPGIYFGVCFSGAWVPENPPFKPLATKYCRRFFLNL